MLVITLICNLGMSTSVLVDKMAAYTKEKGSRPTSRPERFSGWRTASTGPTSF